MNKENKVVNMQEYIWKDSDECMDNEAGEEICFDDVVNLEDIVIREETLKLYNGEKAITLIAESEAEPKRKHVLKHEFVGAACSEYIFSKLARAVDARVPICKLLYVGNNCEDERIKTKFVAGIEMLSQPKQYNSQADHDKVINSDNIWQYYCLSDLLDGPLNVELVYSKRHLYQINGAPNFGLQERELCFIDQEKYPLGNYALRLQGIRNICCNKVNDLEQTIYSRQKATINAMKDDLGDDAWQLKGYYQTMESFVEISDEYIMDMLNNLVVIYPDFMREYFEEYIGRVKVACEMLVNDLY
ncbi:MAG: hypothetical protein RR581_06445 [Eubacterium sp.]